MINVLFDRVDAVCSRLVALYRWSIIGQDLASFNLRSFLLSQATTNSTVST